MKWRIWPALLLAMVTLSASAHTVSIAHLDVAVPEAARGQQRGDGVHPLGERDLLTVDEPRARGQHQFVDGRHPNLLLHVSNVYHPA